MSTNTITVKRRWYHRRNHIPAAMVWDRHLAACGGPQAYDDLLHNLDTATVRYQAILLAHTDPAVTV